MLQELVVRQRDELLYRARRQLRVRDLIIAAQQELLEEHGLTVGPHVESLFGRLDTIEDIFKLDDDRTGLNAMVNQGLAEDGGVSGIELVGAQKWSLGKAIYPVSKIDDIVQVNLARSLQVPRKAEASSRQAAKSKNRGIGGGRGNRRSRRSRSSSSKHHQNDGDSSFETMSSAVTEPEEIGHGSSGQAARRSTRPKVSRSRSQISVHNGRKRMHNISTNNPYQQASREPTARELERAKRRGGNGVKEPNLVVWEQKQQDSGHTKPPSITTSSSSSSGGTRRSRSQHRARNDDRSSDPVVASNGWAERLKMYLKTPRSRFSRNSKDRRSKSPETKKESSSSTAATAAVADKSEKTRTPNQPSKNVGKSRSASSAAVAAVVAERLERPLVLSSPERKKSAFESAGPTLSSSGGANHMFTSPPPTTTSLSAPKKNHSSRIHINTRSPENYADENSRSERKMTPLPRVGSKQRRWSPPPARQMFGDENIKLKSSDADEGRKALSRLNLKFEKFGKKKSRNGGPVVNSRFFSRK